MSVRKILHFTTAATPVAGAERLLADLARHGRRFGWDLAFVTLGPRGDLHRLVEEAGWPAHHLGVGKSLGAPVALWRLRRLLAAERPDVLHTHLHHPSVLAALLPRGEPPHVHTRHYSDYRERYGGAAARRLDSWAARRASAVLAVSEAARDHLVRREQVDPRRVRVARNGIDVERLDAVDRQAGRAILQGLGLGQGPFLGCAASYHPRKGHRVLLDAFAEVLRRLPAARLVLLGTGPGQQEVRRLVRERGWDGQVAVLGFHPRGPEILSALDLYVQPSLEEGFGLAVVEAMALGRPVVASDVGGMKETVLEGQTGLRVPPGDPSALAERVLRVLGDPGWASRLGEAGRARARAGYSIEAMLAAYQRCYDDVLGGGA